MTRSGWKLAACVGLLAVLATGCGPDDGGTRSSAACEAPGLRVEPSTVARAAELTVFGTAFSDGCADSCHVNDDTGVQTCETATPHRAIAVELVPDDGEPLVLTSVDADEDGAFTVTVTVPADAPEGRGSVIADVVSAEPAEVTIVP